MGLSSKTASEIAELLTTTVREKLRRYKPETVNMPFHHRLLGKDRYAMFSFIQSMNTTFGISIWEQVAVILAEGAGNYAERQYKLLGEIDGETEELIREIHYKLRKGEATADKIYETEQIRKKIKRGEAKTDPDSVVDLFVRIKDEENYFDITSAKPNMKEFVALKLKLLRWTALRLSQDKNIKVFTRLAIPYNPYHPEPYERWTLKGLYDLEKGEILVGEEFWNFVACDNIYDELLDVFQEVGEELRDEIDEKFAEFRIGGKD
ncbi:MAG: type II restriction endonuclease TdeIII [Candidatus Syntrophoarchaeum caldarius]|uniref:type II site-specific deoxyribonuclease n=1 Tax=Candidatus Syntropharchaeum caldarium TaxID=1838285 RepID=A0A1F2PCN1_9EURY|nr:MAG: type II restriction endonuclease TdeIII [Candidatus Syntrophoarchaeum caldarius]